MGFHDPGDLLFAQGNRGYIRGYIGVILGLRWGYIRVILGLHWGYIGMMEKKMETATFRVKG